MHLQPLRIRFYPKLKSKNKEEYVLYMRLTLSYQRTDISLGYSLRKEDWDDYRQCLKKANKDYSYVLNMLSQYRHKAQDAYQQLIQRNLDCDVNTIRAEITGNNAADSNKDQHYLLMTLQRLITRKETAGGSGNSSATVCKYKTTKKHLTNFIKMYYKRDDIKFNQLDLKFIEDFEYFLKTECACQNNSSMKHMRNLKTIFKIAQAHGHTDKNPFLNYKLRFEEIDRGFLSEEEVQQLIETDLPSDKLCNVRDIFIFSCYTGLSYIDIKNLTGEHIRKESDRYWIRARRIKTNVKYNVPLLSIALKTILKYSPNFEGLDRFRTVFRVISNQKVNKYLKELNIISGIATPLTFHLARHTFATSVTLNNGVPIESVSAMLGHRKIVTTQHYAKLLGRKLEEDMDKLENKLEEKGMLNSYSLRIK